MLPLLMLAIAVTGLVCVGIVKSKSSVDFTGNYALVNFTHAKKGLMVKDKYGYLKGFEIAGADKQFQYAKATMEGDKIIVWNDEINSFEWVITSLMDVCQHTEEQAEQCALFIHFKGKYAVKDGSYDILKPQCDAITERGINATIEEMAG